MTSAQLDLLDGRRKRHNPKLPSALEGKEQEALFQWKRLTQTRLPELRAMYHPPNGGYRNRREAAALKRRGVFPGVYDVHLPVARQGYIGLWIELKRIGQGRDTTPEQDTWGLLMTEYGHLAVVCEGWEAAREVIEGYLGEPGRSRAVGG